MLNNYLKKLINSSVYLVPVGILAIIAWSHCSTAEQGYLPGLVHG